MTCQHHVDTSFVCSVGHKNSHDVPVFVNVDENEKGLELFEKEPIFWYEAELLRDKVSFDSKRD